MATAPGDQPKRRRRARWAPLALGALALLYVLSYAPVLVLLSHCTAEGYISLDTSLNILWTVYGHPHDWLVDHAPGPVREALDAYLDLWMRL